MPNIIVTNISEEKLFLKDLYTSLNVGASTTTSYRTTSDLMNMPALLRYNKEGKIRIDVEMTEFEEDNDFMFPEVSSVTSSKLRLNIPNTTADIIYVRTSGNDETGDGSLANPYATFVKACEKISTLSTGLRMEIDMTGVNETLPDSFEFPFVFTCEDPFNALNQNFASYFITRGPIHIYAEPEVVETIEVANVTLTTAESGSGIITYTTNFTWTADEFKGFIAVDSNNSIFSVFSNTTNTIRLCSSSAPTLPLQILQRTGTLKSPALSANSTMIIKGSASVIISGINIESHNSGFNLYTSEGIQLYAQGCSFNGGLLANRDSTFFGCSFISQDGDSPIYNQAGSINIFGSNIEQYGFPLAGEATKKLSVTSCVCDEITKWNELSSNVGPQNYNIVNTTIENSPSHGFSLKAGSTATLSNLLIRDSGSNGVYVEGTNAQAYLTNVKGTGNAAHGLKVADGAHVKVNSGTDITGISGNLSVGTLATRTWVNFRGNAPVQNQVDFTANTGDGSRVWEP